MASGGVADRTSAITKCYRCPVCQHLCVWSAMYEHVQEAGDDHHDAIAAIVGVAILHARRRAEFEAIESLCQEA